MGLGGRSRFGCPGGSTTTRARVARLTEGDCVANNQIDFYPLTATDDELAVGFVTGDIRTPITHRYAYVPERTDVVIWRLEGGGYVLKAISPTPDIGIIYAVHAADDRLLETCYSLDELRGYVARMHSAPTA